MPQDAQDSEQFKKILSRVSLTQQGNKLGKQGDYQGAIKYYDEALKLDPKDALAWYNKGYVLTRWGKYQEAIECYDEALKINPQDAAALINKGACLNRLGNHEEAIKFYDRALKVKDIYPKLAAMAWDNWGVALGNLGRYEEAINCFDKALEIDSKYVTAWNNKGITLGKLGRYRKAEKSIKRAVDLEPKDALYLSNWGDMLLKLKRYEGAEETYRRAIKVKETWRPYLGLAKLYIILGDRGKEDWMYEEALANLRMVSELYPDITDTAKGKEDSRDYYFQRGYAHGKLGQWREAEKDFLKCGEDPKAKRNIHRIRNRVKGEGRPSRLIVAGGCTVAGISIIGLIASFVLYLHRFEKITSEKSVPIITPIDADLLKVLVPTFLFFMAVGFSLPYIRVIKGPAGIGFEKEITVRPEYEAGLEPLR